MAIFIKRNNQLVPAGASSIIELLNGLPIYSNPPETLESPSEVANILTSDNLGKVYKYVGQDGNYDYNCYYIVEEVDPVTPGTPSDEAPIALSSSACVLAILTSDNVGKIYRYTGTDGNYDYNCYYIVEEEQ